MRSFQILDTLGFMKKLLTDDAFDTFLLSEASITTFATFQIDGRFHPDYFNTAEQEQLSAEKCGFTLWKRVRPFFFELTRGKHTPLKFRVVFRLAPYNVEKLISQSGLSIQADQVDGLFLNINFDGKALCCVSGVSMKLFALDKTLDHAWDDMLEKFFRHEQIPFLIE
ncbi:MAG: DUF5721 family protein [Lachnospiraceae bacterium]|nr:DUF5721 family protein [Lachnospiraceae bacterium]